MIKPKFLVSLTEFYIFGISFIWELILHYMGIWDVAQGMAMGRDLKAEDINMLKRLQTNTMMIRSSSRFSKILLAAMVYELHKTGMCETTFEKVSTFGPLGDSVVEHLDGHRYYPHATNQPLATMGELNKEIYPPEYHPVDRATTLSSLSWNCPSHSDGAPPSPPSLKSLRSPGVGVEPPPPPQICVPTSGSSVHFPPMQISSPEQSFKVVQGPLQSESAFPWSEKPTKIAKMEREIRARFAMAALLIPISDMN
nr:origin of replication complex subunit 1A-like isoform X1 [Ipomoea batatas]